MSIASRIVGDLHVSASRRDVIHYLRARLRPEVQRSRSHRAARHQLYRDGLAAHSENQKLVRTFRL